MINFKQIFIWWHRQTTGTFLKTLFFGKLVGKDEKGNQREVTESMWERIYGPVSSSTNTQRTYGQNELNTQGAPVGYDAARNTITRSQKGKEIKKLSKWAVPFYSGKMGM